MNLAPHHALPPLLTLPCRIMARQLPIPSVICLSLSLSLSRARSRSLSLSLALALSPPLFSLSLLYLSFTSHYSPKNASTRLRYSRWICTPRQDAGRGWSDVIQDEDKRATKGDKDATKRLVGEMGDQAPALSRSNERYRCNPTHAYPKHHARGRQKAQPRAKEELTPENACSRPSVRS